MKRLCGAPRQGLMNTLSQRPSLSVAPRHVRTHALPPPTVFCDQLSGVSDPCETREDRGCLGPLLGWISIRPSRHKTARNPASSPKDGGCVSMRWQPMALPLERTCQFPGEARPGANLPHGETCPAHTRKGRVGLPRLPRQVRFWALCQVAYREGSKNSDNSHNH